MQFIEIQGSIMINSNEERYMASDSLKGLLKPEMLEVTKTSTSNFSLVAGKEAYPLESYSEDSQNTVITFACNDSILINILTIKSEKIALQCGENKITRNLAGHEISWDIVKIESGNYRVTLSFSRSQVGTING